MKNYIHITPSIEYYIHQSLCIPLFPAIFKNRVKIIYDDKVQEDGMKTQNA